MAIRVEKNPDSSMKKATLPERLKLPSEGPMRLISNSVVMGDLSKNRVSELGDATFLTGSLVAYPARGQGFEEKIEMHGNFGNKYVIDTSMFIQLAGAALFLDAGTYDMVVDGKVHVFKPKPEFGIDVIYNFPQKTGERFGVHKTSGIPVDMEGPILLYRRDRATFAPVVRSFEHGQAIHLDRSFEERHVVVLSDNSSAPPRS